MALDRTLVQIRERSFLELLDLALIVVRQRPLALGATAAAGAAPFAAVYAWFAADPETWPVTLLFCLAMAAPWATAPLTVVLGGLMFGERPPAGRVVRTILRGFPAMLLYQGLLRTALIVTVVPIVIIPAQLAFLDEVILLERGRGVERSRQSVYRRCSNLCGGRAWELLGQWVGSLFFGVLFLFAFRWALETLVEVLADEATWDRSGLEDPANWALQQFGWFGDLRAWSAQLGIWFLLAFFGVVRFLTYIDQRIRLEGWEIELRLRVAGAAMEDAERW